MRQGRLLGGLTLAAALAVSLTGCAKLKLDMAKSCQAHGGTWSQAQESCSMPGGGGSSATKHARDICAYQGGTYLPGGSCILDGT